MKKYIFICLLLLSAIIKAEIVELSFEGTGAINAIDSIIVVNLHNGLTKTLMADVALTVEIPVTRLQENSSSDNIDLLVYPNPMVQNAQLKFSLEQNSKTDIQIFDCSGKLIIQSTQFLEKGNQKYILSGLSKGIYLVTIKEQSSTTAMKLICLNNSNDVPKISYVSTETLSWQNNRNKEVKSAGSENEFEYNYGDRLMFTAMSGDYTTILTVVPTHDTTYTFEFFECKDADENQYSTVKIGTQVWMAENLRATRFNDSTPIPKITVDTIWPTYTTPEYCWYKNDSLHFSRIYGALYNWYTIDTNSNGDKNVCPVGWHAAGNNDWSTLNTNIGQSDKAGGKLKSIGTQHWTAPNTGATNETGFNALGAGWRGGLLGIFVDFGIYACFWSTTASTSSNINGFYIELDYNTSMISRYDFYKSCGFSVRCVKDAE